jgi:hypothetical protein
MTPQETNRRDGDLMSCHGHSQKLRAFTWKELETVGAAQKLLGVPTFGRGVPGQGVVVEGVKGGKYAPMPAKIHKKGTKNRRFPILIELKIVENAVFSLKST